MTPSSTQQNLIGKNLLFPFIMITSLFFLWGVANNMTDTLLAAFKRIMSMSDSQTSLIQVVFYGAGYGLLALPAAIFIKKYTYKAGVLLGLGLYALGAILFYPAMLTAEFGWFLAALWILSGGLSILETAANPYIISMGPEESGTRRLNLAQSFNPIGSISGVFVSQVFILSQLNQSSAEERASMSPDELITIQSAELNAVTLTYVVLGLLLILLWIVIAANKRMPKTADHDAPLDLVPTFKRLFSQHNYVWGIVAQFFYVGAQIGVWSFTIRYVMQELRLEETALPGGKTPEEMAANYYMASLVLFTISRFICTWLMKFISPARLLLILGIVAACLSLLTMNAGGLVGVYSLIGISGCMSLMFPTIFGLACRGLGEDAKLGGSGLIMAIFGGAVFTQLQGVISDATSSVNFSFIVPFFCFLVVAFYGRVASRYLSQKEKI